MIDNEERKERQVSPETVMYLNGEDKGKQERMKEKVKFVKESSSFTRE